MLQISSKKTYPYWVFSILASDPAPEGRSLEVVRKNQGDPPHPHIATRRGQDPGPAQGIGQGFSFDLLYQMFLFVFWLIGT